MKFKEWNEIAEFVGIAAIVGSLIFVGLQMKQAQDIANAERRMLFVANIIELNNAINEHTDVWMRGTSGQDLEAIEATVFANLMNDKEGFAYFSARAAREGSSRMVMTRPTQSALTSHLPTTGARPTGHG